MLRNMFDTFMNKCDTTYQENIENAELNIQDKDIIKVAAILIELNTPKELAINLISKYWDLKPSDSESYLSSAKRIYFKS